MPPTIDTKLRLYHGINHVAVPGGGMRASCYTVIIAFAVAGCSATPQVGYVDGTSKNVLDPKIQPRILDSFYQPKSRLSIDFKNTADPGKAPKYQLSVTDDAVEDTTHRVIVLKDNDWFSSTNVSISKRANSDLIDSIGVEVIDNRASLITEAGSILKLVGPLLFSGAKDGSKDETPEKDLSVTWALDDSGFFDAPKAVNEGQRYVNTQRKNLTVTVGPVSTTAIPYQNAIASFLTEDVAGIWYPACRSVHVIYNLSNGALEWRGKISDPTYLEYVAFPNKGKIQFQPQCGVSVSTEKDSVATTDALLSSAVTQAFAIHDAINKPK